jgi:hypothetical protein
MLSEREMGKWEKGETGDLVETAPYGIWHTA